MDFNMYKTVFRGCAWIVAAVIVLAVIVGYLHH